MEEVPEEYVPNYLIPDRLAEEDFYQEDDEYIVDKVVESIPEVDVNLYDPLEASDVWGKITHTDASSFEETFAKGVWKSAGSTKREVQKQEEKED